MKKVIKCALAVGALATCIGVSTYSITRVNAYKNAEKSREALEDTIESSLKFAETIKQLHADPSITNAQTAQWQSMDTCGILLFNSYEVRGGMIALASEYLSDANWCIEGLRKVKGHDQYISNYVENIQRRKDIVAELAFEELDRQEGKYDEAEKRREKLRENLMKKAYESQWKTKSL